MRGVSAASLVLMAALGLTRWTGVPALAQEGAYRSAARADRGLSGAVGYDLSQGPLRARPDQPTGAPVRVRVVRPDAKDRQRIEFIGAVAGTFDLREYLEKEDGSALPGSFSLPVTIVSRLPAGPETDVAGIRRSELELRRHYTPIAVALWCLWLSVPAVVLARRAMRRPVRQPVAPAPPAPSLADDIRALLGVARERRLTVAERGRLELLIMQFLQGQGAVPDESPLTLPEQVERVKGLRTNPQTRRVVLSIEAWLHQPPAGAGSGSATREEDAAAALDEFRQSALPPPQTAPEAIQ